MDSTTSTPEIPEPKRRPRKTFVVEFSPTWEAVRKEVLRIDRRGFGAQASDEDDMRKTWNDAILTAVLRQVEPAGEVIGYTVVDSSWPDTAYIRYTAIAPEHRGKGRAGVLLTAIEEELRAMGVQFISRDARIENGYADKLEKYLGDRVVAKYDHASDIGPLRFIRARL